MKKSKPKLKSIKYPYGGESAALTGALGGASLGMEFGPWGALAGAGIGAGLGYMNEQNQEAQNKQYAIDQNLNNVRNQGVQRIKNSPIMEGAPQAAYKYGGIHIKPSHKGRFTAYKERTGKTTEEALHSKDPHVRQMANFARNAAKWKHEYGGYHIPEGVYENGGIQGFTLTPSDYFPNGGKYVTPLANLNNFYPPMKKPVISTKKYDMGGIHNGEDNAEIEKQEVVQHIDGSTESVNGPTHNSGGVPVNLEGGARIYSDRLKDIETKKTFAQLASKYKVNKEEKILEDKKSSSLATSTAKLNMQLKQQKLNEIFNKQELLKRSKVYSYAKQLGINLEDLNHNIHQNQPYFKNGGIMEGDYELNEISESHINDLKKKGYKIEYV